MKYKIGLIYQLHCKTIESGSIILLLLEKYRYQTMTAAAIMNEIIITAVI